MAWLRWHHTPVARASTLAVFIGGTTILMLATPDAARASYIGRESYAPSAVDRATLPSICSSIEIVTHASSSTLSVRAEAVI